MSKHRYFAIYKPFQVLSQFSAEGEKQTLKAICKVPKDVYPVGRLDYDSEGLLLLTNDASINRQLLHPTQHVSKTYWVQVEGEVTENAMATLRNGVTIQVNGQAHHTVKCKVELLPEPQVAERNPPIRQRAHIPTAWLSITLTEGKNRQVRKMTAAVGLPTLRLIRVAIGNLTLGNLQPGQQIELSANRIKQIQQLG